MQNGLVNKGRCTAKLTGAFANLHVASIWACNKRISDRVVTILNSDKIQAKSEIMWQRFFGLLPCKFED